MREENRGQHGKVEGVSAWVSEHLYSVPSSATNWLADLKQISPFSEPQFSHLLNGGTGSDEYNYVIANVRSCSTLCSKRAAKQIIKYSRIMENGISLNPLPPVGSEVDRRAQTLVYYASS